jgi:hypothetical protein
MLKPGPHREPSMWLVESKAAWISPSSVLRIPVPCFRGARFLSLEFEVTRGGYVDFDVMLESEDEKSASRLYGPSRRAHSVRTCLPLPHPGVAFVTFDNISSWITPVQLKYTLRLTADEPAEQATLSRLRFGNVIGHSSQQSAPQWQEEEEEEEEVRRALAASERVETTVASGAMEEVEMRVQGKTSMYVSVDVEGGRDIDFGIVFLPEQPEPADEQEEPRPHRLFGPCRRATNLSANVAIPGPGTVVLGFDNSGSWVRPRKVFFRVRLGDGTGPGAELL